MEMKLLTEKEFNEYIPSFSKLFEVSFNRKIKEEFFKWRYLDNPVKDLLVAVAIDKGEIVANYSVSPMLVERDGNVYKTAISMTTMTHPKYEGRGLFNSLAKMIYDEMKRRNYVAVWGFPNSISHGVFIKKLGWKDVYEIPTMSLNLDKLEMIKNNDDFNVVKNNCFDIFENEVQNHNYHTKKSKEYYQWRYAKHPYNIYENYVVEKDQEYVGNMVIKIYNNSIDIIEFNFIEDEEIKVAIHYLINLGIKNKYQRISGWVNLFNTSHTTFERLGFENTKPITYFSLKNIINDSLTLNYKDYDFSMGDSDVY